MIPRLLVAATVVALVVFLTRLDSLRPGRDDAFEAPPDLSAIDLTSLDRSRLSDAAPVGEAIRKFEERVEANPSSYIDYTILGQLYMRQSRENGDIAALLRAEAALKRALDINPAYTAARASLAAALHNQHRFEEAKAMAQSIAEGTSVSVQAVATLADARFALGDYDQATAGFIRLTSIAPGPASQIRLAQLEHLRGNIDEALRLTRSAAAAEYASGATPEGMAWYLARIGDLYFGVGELQNAARHYQAALKLFDRHYPSLAGLARVRAAEGKLGEAIELYKRAVEVVPLPAMLAELGDAYAAAGDDDEAVTQYQTVELIATIARLNQAVFNRELVIFYADHNIRVDMALRLAESEIGVRSDVYGYDALAWALYRNGRYDEANSAMQKALEHGTRDASLHFHAALIRKALGDLDGERTHLAAVVRTNPRFSLLHAPRVQAELASLSAAR
ncbi:MAG: tetratricopeptide repeat protein [Chloroflexi bacterium]|nr:tetratricopeptide repeat protein [Chloroflexota bacterium]